MENIPNIVTALLHVHGEMYSINSLWIIKLSEKIELH